MRRRYFSPRIEIGAVKGKGADERETGGAGSRPRSSLTRPLHSAGRRDCLARRYTLTMLGKTPQSTLDVLEGVTEAPPMVDITTQ